VTDFEQMRSARGGPEDIASNNAGEDAGDQIDIAGSRFGRRPSPSRQRSKANGKRAIANGAAVTRTPSYARSKKTASALAPAQPIIGSSQPIKDLREKIALFAREDDHVLITGETGSGKELVAREIHALSPRANGPLVVRNVGRIDRELAGSDFFGHNKGAFTGANDKRIGLFEQANGGSLHLDEIAELPLELQANLLRVVEDGLVTPLGGSAPRAVNVRLIAATNVDLASAVEMHKFRDDLFYRLGVLRLATPPLRERGDDLFEIAEYLLAQRGAACGRTPKLTADARSRLQSYSWPGNVRELKNVLISAAVVSGGETIDAEHIEFNPPCSANRGCLDINQGRELISQYLAAKALKRSGDNVAAAARLTKTNRTSFYEVKAKMVGPKADLTALARELREFLRIC